METSIAKKICVVANSFSQYKSDYAGKFIENLIIALSKGYETHIIYPSKIKPQQSNSELFYRHQVPYPFQAYPMSQVHGMDYINTIRLSLNMLAKIREVVRNHDIDLIHAYWAIPSGFLAALGCGDIPLVLTLPGSDMKIFGKKRMLKHPVKYALKRATKIITRSNELKGEAVKLGAEEHSISILPAGVNIDRFKPMDKLAVRSKLGLSSGFIMLFAGSLIRVKRVNKLINLFANLNKDFNCYLVIAGQGSEEENLKKLARELKLKNVLFKGEIPYEDMPLYMASSDVLLLASESEGLPGCVQEAMASGIPVVTSNVGGLPEIVSDGINGYLTRNEAEMEERLRMLMSSPQLVEQIGANALEFARQNLSFDVVVKRTEELYASVLGSHLRAVD